MSEITAFVTGGTGFVGSNLVAGLNNIGIKPRLLHRQASSLQALKGLEYDAVIGDILDEPSTLSANMEGVDWLFHTAGISDYWRNGRETLFRINVDGTRNMLEASRLAGIGRFIFTSSLGSFGIPEDGQPINESCIFNLRPEQLPYGYSKHLAELAVLEAFAGGLDVAILNPGIILGPRDFKQVSGSIVTEAARGLLRFNLPGALSFVSVEDVVAGHISAAQRGESGQKYILSGPNLTIKEAGAIVCQVVGRPRPKIDIPSWVLPPAAIAIQVARAILGNRIPMDPNQVRLAGKTVFADSRKAEKTFDLSWTPFREMIERTYDWYVANGIIKPANKS